ncbi:unnamed protein product (macronuclear) [Paramecium tetraurelia]|uniref:Uncharacterized protein n=1 Tax=Paramecium tetraurelia TaxID=5888 RepID=A0CSP8_PARTE|nr:uncharacterized protein GSPATT00010087001 [Paramecium tetraurelia]CAK73815.1 unnamed protein product [Paramecium tetraurelia]|eukprot:XP_001441212.1 hypothetical protein (macronuclear) [Paramecium tetraurelia strain d4-2]
MGALIHSSQLKSQIEYLDEDNTITVNVPKTFQYYPKLCQYDDEIDDINLGINEIEVNKQCFIFFQTTIKEEQLNDIDDSRETPSWNTPQVSNKPEYIQNPRMKSPQKKSKSKKKQRSRISQRINLEDIF